MSGNDTTAGFRDELTKSEWNRVGEVLIAYCRKTLLRFILHRLRPKSSHDAEDVLMRVVEKALEGLMDGKPTWFSSPGIGENRKQMVESLHAMCRNDGPVPTWLKQKVSFLARRECDFFNRARVHKPLGSKAEISEDEIPKAIDEHAPPDLDTANREELEWLMRQITDPACDA